MLTVEQIAAKYARLRAKNGARDTRMADILAVRQGDIGRVAPGLFPDDWPKPIIANFVDVACRDLAELIAPLPSINCAVTNMVNDSAKKFAAKKTKIAHWYVQNCEMERQLFAAADQYLSYGFLPFYVEPDFQMKAPRIVAEDPQGAYVEYDRWQRPLTYTKRWLRTVDDLCADWPEYELQLRGDDYERAAEGGGSALVELIRYCDKDQITLFVPARNNLVLVTTTNLLGRTPVVVARRPSVDEETRGQFDDVMWVQIARARMALLGLEAAEKSVQAPIALPSDVQEMALGSDAILRSSTPEKIRRVGLELPQGAFVESQMLDQEMRVGSRYPGARSGEQSASIITGRGIQELLGGFDTQVKTAQLIIGHALQFTLRLCFEMDERFWPNDTRTVRGTANGAPFEEKYTPAKDIKGDYTVQVDYGFAAGMDPNRAVVFLLQLRGDKLIDRDTVQRQLPWDVDVVKLQERIDVEEVNDALKQGVFAYVQALPVMVQQGMDPAIVLTQVAHLITARQEGAELSTAVLRAFAPQQPPGAQTPDAGPGQGAPGGPPGGTLPPAGLQPSGLPDRVAPGQAGMPPGGRPDLQMLLAGLNSSGNPQMSASVARRVPVVQ